MLLLSAYGNPIIMPNHCDKASKQQLTYRWIDV